MMRVNRALLSLVLCHILQGCYLLLMHAHSIVDHFQFDHLQVLNVDEPRLQLDRSPHFCELHSIVQQIHQHLHDALRVVLEGQQALNVDDQVEPLLDARGVENALAALENAVDVEHLGVELEVADFYGRVVEDVVELAEQKLILKNNGLDVVLDDIVVELELEAFKDLLGAVQGRAQLVGEAVKKLVLKVVLDLLGLVRDFLSYVNDKNNQQTSRVLGVKHEFHELFFAVLGKLNDIFGLIANSRAYILLGLAVFG